MPEEIAATAWTNEWKVRRRWLHGGERVRDGAGVLKVSARGSDSRRQAFQRDAGRMAVNELFQM